MPEREPPEYPSRCIRFPSFGTQHLPALDLYHAGWNNKLRIEILRIALPEIFDTLSNSALVGVPEKFAYACNEYAYRFV